MHVMSSVLEDQSNECVRCLSKIHLLDPGTASQQQQTAPDLVGQGVNGIITEKWAKVETARQRLKKDGTCSSVCFAILAEVPQANPTT